MKIAKFLTQNKARFKETIGSSFIGRFEISYKELRSLLGQPHFSGRPDNKVDVEWAYVIDRDKKTVVTIYNYKSDSAIAYETDWHIGGHGDHELIREWVQVVFNRPMTK
jgi:hypothetical protein